MPGPGRLPSPKFHAPTGVGAKYVRAGTPIRPVLHGAEQEHGLRPGGTENIAAIVAAAALAAACVPTATAHLRAGATVCMNGSHKRYQGWN